MAERAEPNRSEDEKKKRGKEKENKEKKKPSSEENASQSGTDSSEGGIEKLLLEFLSLQDQQEEEDKKIEKISSEIKKAVEKLSEETESKEVARQKIEEAIEAAVVRHLVEEEKELSEENVKESLEKLEKLPEIQKVVQESEREIVLSLVLPKEEEIPSKEKIKSFSSRKIQKSIEKLKEHRKNLEKLKRIVKRGGGDPEEVGLELALRQIKRAERHLEMQKADRELFSKVVEGLNEEEKEVLEEKEITSFSGLIAVAEAEAKEEPEEEKINNILLKIVAQENFWNRLRSIDPELGSYLENRWKEINKKKEEAEEFLEKLGKVGSIVDKIKWAEAVNEALSEIEKEPKENLVSQYGGWVESLWRHLKGTSLEEIRKRRWTELIKKKELTQKDVVDAAVYVLRLAQAGVPIENLPLVKWMLETFTERLQGAKGEERKKLDENISLWAALIKIVPFARVRTPTELREVKNNLPLSDLERIMTAQGMKEAFDALFAADSDENSDLRKATDQKSLDKALEGIAQKLKEEEDFFKDKDIAEIKLYLEMSFTLFRFFRIENYTKLLPEDFRKGLCFYDWVDGVGRFGVYFGEQSSQRLFRTPEGEEVGPKMGLGITECYQMIITDVKGLEAAGFKLKVVDGKLLGRRLLDWNGNEVESIDDNGEKVKGSLIYTKIINGKEVLIEVVRYADPENPNDRGKDKVVLVEIRGALTSEEVLAFIKSSGKENFLGEKYAKTLGYLDEMRKKLAELGLSSLPPSTEEEFQKLLEFFHDPNNNFLLSRAGIHGDRIPPWVLTKEDVMEQVILASLLKIINSRHGRMQVENYYLMPNVVKTGIIGFARENNLITEEGEKRLRRKAWKNPLKEKVGIFYDANFGVSLRSPLVARFLLFGWLGYFFKALLQSVEEEFKS
ncbi:hypothetical protein J7J95_00990 [bacterium]|nr:hypothetical protein [bacterium]